MDEARSVRLEGCQSETFLRVKRKLRKRAAGLWNQVAKYADQPPQRQ